MVAKLGNNMTNSIPMPEFEVVAAELQDFTDVVWAVLEVANERSVAFFAQIDDGIPRVWDPSVHAGLVRYFAINLLDRLGIKAAIEEADEVPFDRIDLANNGIYLRHGRYHIRIRKASDGKLPAPSSAAQVAFYLQEVPLPGITISTDYVNLLLLWDVVTPEHALKDLVLACPKNVNDKHWGESLNHPALRIAKPVKRETSDDDFDQIVPAAPGTIRAQE